MTVAVVTTATLPLADLVIPDHLQRDLRRAEEFIQLAVVAAQQALAGAPDRDGRRTGIYLGTAFGPMACNLAVLDDLVLAEPISPTLFSHSVFNAAAGYIARTCQISGPAMTLTSFGWPFFTALQAAWLAIRANKLDHALVLQVETYADLLHDARAALLPSPAPPWPAGATAWLLGQEGTIRLANILVEEKPCPPLARLSRRENSAQPEGCHPMAALAELTSLIASDHCPHSWQESGDYGRVELKMTRGEG